jgi:hypothetical protein
MVLKVHIFFVLVGLFALVQTQAVNLTCTREMVESYGIISNDQAKKERLVMCPQIQYSCCPAYEQFKMFKTYSDTAKPSFILLNEVIKKELSLLEVEVIKLVNSGVIDQKIQSISDKAIQMRVQYTWNKIKNQRPQAIFQKLQKYQKVSSSYVAAWKSAFFCTICDFANQNFIDVQNKKITYSAASCDALVFNTLLFTNLLNTVLIPYLSSLTEIITRLKGNGKYQKLHNIRRVNKAIKDCAADYKQYDSGLGNCKAYCEYFNPVQDNYVFEGYPEFFANTLVEIRLFSGGGGGASGSKPAGGAPKRKLIEDSVRELIRKTKAKNRRLREKVENDSYFEVNLPKSSKFKGFKSMRILEEQNELAELERVHQEHAKLENRRILQENGDWSQDLLDPNNNVTKIIDIFDREASDPEFDDAMVNQMMQVQDIFNTGDPALYAQMIRKYYVDNFSADLDDIDSENLFKETTLARVDYTQFQTIFSFAGIDIHRIVDKMNWSLAFKQIGVSLTATTNEESEMIFPDVVQAINAVANSDVRDFYRNQFVRFRKPNYQLFAETMNGLLHNFAINKLRHLIAENMAVYNFLVRTGGQDNADKIWGQIEMIRAQLKGLTMNNQNFTVTMYNQTLKGNVTVQSLNITSAVNASGFANVTTIQDVKALQSSYQTSTQLVNENQKAGYDQFIAVANATANSTGNSTAPKRSLMGDKRKHKMKK